MQWLVDCSLLSIPCGANATHDASVFFLCGFQFVFASFGLIEDDNVKKSFLSAILGPVVCVFLEFSVRNRGSNSHLDAAPVLCGTVITSIARSSPLMFKEQISVLPDDYKLLLQNNMRSALQQQQQQAMLQAATNVTSSATDSMKFKKIDMSKYKGSSAV